MQNKIKELRARHNLTQEDLATGVGISRNSLMNIEKGEAIPAGSTLLKIAQFFKLPAEEVFALDESDTEETAE